MRVVMRAFDEKLHRVIALKALDTALASNGSARQRFVREARAAAAVSHDNVIAIHGVEDAGPVPYLVMQFIDVGPGRPLRRPSRTGRDPVSGRTTCPDLLGHHPARAAAARGVSDRSAQCLLGR
jgi:serine/threonine protein kinase